MTCFLRKFSLRGEGGGPGQSLRFFLFKHILLFGLCRFRNFLQNWKIFSRCCVVTSQSWLLRAQFRKFQWKIGQKNDFLKYLRAIFSTVDAPNDLNLVLWQDWGNILVPTEDILKILIFWWFSAISKANFGQKWQKWSNFDLWSAKNRRKIKIFKISSVGTKILPQSCHKTKFGSFGYSPGEKIAHTCNFLTQILTIFPLKLPKSRA